MNILGWWFLPTRQQTIRAAVELHWFVSESIRSMCVWTWKKGFKRFETCTKKLKLYCLKVLYTLMTNAL